MYRRHLRNQIIVILAEIVTFALCSLILLFGVYFIFGDRSVALVCWAAPVVLFVAVVLTSMTGEVLERKFAEATNKAMMDEKLFIESIRWPAKAFERWYMIEEVKKTWDTFQNSGRWERGVMVGDGGMATELYKTELYKTVYDQGLDRFMSLEWWNIEHPDEIQAVHERYIKAGAQAILTNTLGANSKRLEKNKLHKYSVEDLNYAGVEIARRATQRSDVLVFGKMGPTGCAEELIYSGGNRGSIRQDLHKVFREQALALWKAGSDGIWIEAMSYLNEAVLAVKAAREATDIPVICSMCFVGRTFRGLPNAFRTLWGDTVHNVVNDLTKSGATVIGASCGTVIEKMPLLARRMRELTDLPLVFEVNAGHPRDVQMDYRDYKAEYRLRSPAFAKIVFQVIRAGGNIVGGCCGTRPEHIVAAREAIRAKIVSLRA